MNNYKKNIHYTVIFIVGWSFRAAGSFESLLKFLRVVKWYLISNMHVPILCGICKYLKHVVTSTCTFSLRAATSKFVFPSV